MELVSFLILFPFIIGLVLFAIRQDGMRDTIVIVSGAVIAVATLALLFTRIGTSTVYFEVDPPFAEGVCTALSIVVGAVVLWFAVKYKNMWAGVLAAVQLACALVFDFVFAGRVKVEQGLYLDSLSLLMAFIIGVIGTGICVYALGYMKDFQAEHAEEKDRRPFFFGIMFIFLGAMYLIVFSNNMTWLFTGWEITTVSSFLLIGYTRTEEAIRNAFRQIIMNIAGGLGFIAALFFCVNTMGTLSLAEFLQMGVVAPALVAFPVTCLAFAGITKSAQMPFHSWLLGAMVAPTPTSALLHSSTMVKAGVFLLIKLAPIFAVSMVPSLMVILVGGLTFMLASFMAISQSNAKRVLAYSTVANLGLIVACAGVGTPEAVWAALFLTLFHAIAKSLLFLCVGTAEHHIGSRNIEDMDLMFERMPRLARLMMLGIMCMFIAPFGMLVSKWATLVSFIDTQQVALILVLAFGSAATFMFWAKWLGKLSGIAAHPDNIEGTVHATEWTATSVMAALILVGCAFMPIISSQIVMPYVMSVFGFTQNAITDDILWITSILAVAVFVVLFAGLGKTSKDVKKVDVYLAGVSMDNEARSFQNSFSKQEIATVRNMYLDSFFGEGKITPVATAATTLVIVVAFAVALPSVFAVL